MNFFKTNPCLITDAYKVTHWMQRPANMIKLYSYGEPRKGGQYKDIVFVGLLPIIKEYFMRVPTMEEIDIAELNALHTFGYKEYFSREIWEKVHKLGYMPVKIRAVKEGTILPENNVCYTIESTEEFFAPMLSHFEDALMWSWYTSAVATRAYNLYKGIKVEMDRTSDVGEFVMPFAVNDFGLRGAMGAEQGAIMGGMSHLVVFDGTDNLPAIEGIRQYYGSAGIGKSVWATEHSVATSYGPGQGEYDYLNAQLDRAPDDATISIVIDSYDADNFIKKVVLSCKDKIVNRSGRTVFRPDSGDALTNLVKYTDMLGHIFGYSMNNKDFKVLNSNVGLIQGDGMDEVSIPNIYRDFTQTGWAADNFITGSGGGLLVIGLSRDTQRWAIKASYAIVNGVEIDIRKVPATDMTKASKCGQLKLHRTGGKFMTFESSTCGDMFSTYTDELETVFENGKLLRDTSFEEVRQTFKSYL